ncbi:COMM domain-containing protein 5 [Clupea harengus]|uniref:COMM domain-containing protein 5 n=1 Tax=Clupea harengus TaxID=7950 RepID=A0A6P3VT51_CLUHA|nr:COMM domain-containing protein 5 [Clupea harengus]
MASGYGKAGGAVGDNVTFLCGGVLPEVEIMSKYLKELDKEQFRSILKAVVNTIEGKDCCEAMNAIVESGIVTEEKLSHIIAGMFGLLKEALRLPKSSLKHEVFQEDLRALRISEECITDFSSVVFGNRRMVLETVGTQQVTQLPSIKDFTWRVDVAISTSSISRALQPSILTQIQLSDDTRHCFEIPVSKFQELRYNVALILKEMNDLEKKNILKIQD